jgi:HK97 family phage prohead protease
MTKLISTAEFHRNAQAGQRPRGPVFRIGLEPVEDVDGKPRTKRFCFSDESVDRMGDTISVNGWDLSDFTKNPVALWAHDSSAPPIGRASNVGVVGRRLMGDIEFADAATYEFADTVYRLVDGRFIRAVSVGFLPVRYKFVENDPTRGFGVDFLEQILLEISVCPVPANPNALGEARAKGIDTRPVSRWAGRALDSGRGSIVSRDYLSRLRADAQEPPRVRAHTSGHTALPARAETTADRLARAEARAARLEGDEGAVRAHQWQPPPSPPPAEQLAADHYRRHAAATAWLAWW